MGAALRGWRPLIKSALTSGTVMSAGDFLCQAIRSRAAGNEITIDYRQTARFGLVGLTLHGPLFHNYFRFLDRRFGQSSTVGQAALKTAVGQVTIFPFYVTSFFTYMGLLESLSLSECAEKVKKATPQTFAAGCAFWPIVNVFNFLYVAPAGRVMYVNVAGLFWNIWLSYENGTQGKVEHKVQHRESGMLAKQLLTSSEVRDDKR